MAAVGAGVGDDVDLDRGQRAVALGAELHPRRHLVARGGADELLLAGELPLHRPAGLERGEHAEILGEHLLLAAEAAADALGEDVQVARAQAEEVAELLLRDERRLRAGADMDAAVVAAPGDRAVRLQMHVLHARGRVGPLVHGVGRGEAVRHAADLAVDIDVDVAFGSAPPLSCSTGASGRHRGDRVEHRRQDLVARPRAAGSRPRRRPRSPRPRRRRAGRRSARRCRGCRCRPDRPGGPHGSRCCRAGAARPPR